MHIHIRATIQFGHLAQSPSFSLVKIFFYVIRTVDAFSVRHFDGHFNEPIFSLQFQRKVIKNRHFIPE